MEDFSVSLTRSGAHCELMVAGDVLTGVTEELVEAGRLGLTDADTQTLVVDLGAVTFIDTTGLGALVAIRNVSLSLSKQLRLRNVPARIVRVLEIAGLDRTFAVEPADSTHAHDLDVDGGS